MFSTIRKRFTYANVALTLALVFAMSGGAYAASKYLITSTSQISPQVLKSLKGARGPRGAQGTQGSEGARGKEAVAGKEGPAGKEGAPGKEGPAGKEGAAGKEGKPGEEGAPGTEGSPWAAGGTLPPGQTETGTWEVRPNLEGEHYNFVPISFPIPLKAEEEGGGKGHGAVLGASKVHLVNYEETGVAGCPGSSFEPKAEPGNLCIYQKEGNASEFKGLNLPGGTQGPSGVASSGTVLTFKTEGEGGYAYGTWAVTAPEEQ